MVRPRVAEAVDAAAAAGPFFSLDLDAPPEGAAGDGTAWRRFSTLVGDRGVLDERIAAVRGAVAARAGVEAAQIDRRAAASLTHLSLAARLVCPPLGCALLGGVLIDLDAANLWWRDVLGPVPLALPGAAGREVDPDDVAATVAGLAAGYATGPVAALVAAVAATGVSPKVLWGNVASAVAGAVPALLAADRDRAGAIGEVVAGLIATDPLAGTGIFERTPGGGLAFRRNSCCLYYRVPGGGLCGDCVLAGRAGL